jgi:HK97 family phage portal protein
MSLIKDLRGAVNGLAALANNASGAQRNNLENPDVPLSSPAAAAYIGGNPTSTGVAVNENRAMGVGAILAGIRVLSESVASLSLETYRRLPDGGRQRATDHPLYRMLKLRPNPFMSGFNYREQLMKRLILRGNHYAEIQFGPDGYPIALWPLPVDTQIVYTDRESLVYVTTIGNERIGLPSWRVLHLSSLGDGITGKGILDYARETIGYAAALDEYQGRFFSNGARPGGYLKHPGKLTDEGKKRLKSGWEMAYGGLSNAHRVAVLEENVEYQRTSVNPEEAQALESRKFTRSEVGGILRVPAHFINDLEKATFSNIEHLNINFAVHSLRPYLVRDEQEMNFKLFAGEPDMFVEYNIDSLLRGDKKSRAEALEIERRNGIISANEWRKMENKNPIDSDYGNSFVVQMNNALIHDNGKIVSLSDATESKSKLESMYSAVDKGLLPNNDEVKRQVAEALGLSLSDESFSRQLNPNIIQRAFLEDEVLRVDELRGMVGLSAIGGDDGQRFVYIGQRNTVVQNADDSTSGERSEGGTVIRNLVALELRRIARREAHALDQWMKSTDAQAIEEAEAIRSFYDQAAARFLDEGLFEIRSALGGAEPLDMDGYAQRSIALYGTGGLENWEERRVRAELAAVGGTYET